MQTPGPWRIEPKDGREDARGYWLHDDNGEYVAMVCRQNNETEELPNARLIAAAPELLEATRLAKALIEDMARFVGKMALQDYALFNEAPIKLQAALAKAQGE